MTRKEYIDALSRGLAGFDEASRRDIILEIEDHIDELSLKHADATEDEIIADLEKPEVLAEGLCKEAGIDPSGDKRQERESRHAGSGKARFTIDGDDFEDIVRKAFNVARLFKESKIVREDRSTSGETGRKSEKRVKLQDIPIGHVKKITFNSRTTDVKVLLSVDGFSMQADGPENTQFSIDDDEEGLLEIRTGNGRDEPEELELRVPSSVESLSIRTLSGDVMVLDRMGDLEIQTASGDVTVKACSGNISVRTASGDIVLEHCSENVTVYTASGSVETEADDQCNEVVISTASGDISFCYPRDFDADVKWSTVSGEVEHDAVATGISTARIGAGLTPVRLSTASGDIDIRRL
jgi:hypothetical protein